MWYGIDKLSPVKFTGDSSNVVEISRHATLQEATANLPKGDEIRNIRYIIVKRGR